MSDDIASKVVNIPEGTEVINALDSSKHYLIKSLETAVFLKQAATPDTSLDITASQAINLDDPSVIPAFVNPNLGPCPTITTIKYSEGNLVQ